MIAEYDSEIPVMSVSAGKLRRYNHLNFWQHLTLPAVVFPNIRDTFLIIGGFFQSFWQLIRWRPDVIFLKGGFVCLPVGLAARVLNIPFVIHDSDAHPGLTNRILAPYAKKIATGAPLKYYNYPKEKSQYVGIPVSDGFTLLSNTQQLAAKERWGIEKNKPLVVITGGGLGAKRINQAVIKARAKLEKLVHIVLIAGQDDYEVLKNDNVDTENFTLYDFISSDMSGLLGAADVVVTRAGATSLLELAALHKPTILVPNARLTGGHQLKNAKVYQDEGAVVIIDEQEMEQDTDVLIKAISSIIKSQKTQETLSSNIGKFAKPNAASEVAQMVIEVGKK